MGLAVVNATYRGAAVAPAPAAVEDARCALLWVAANSARHGFDAARIALTGDSAGSHLALMAGLAVRADGFDRACPAGPDGAAPVEPRVAAIVNWYGATDVGDLIEGAHAQPFAMAWIGDGPDRRARARRVSPVAYVRRGSPSVLTVHGDADAVVPYEHARHLHAELARHGVSERLVTVPGGGHGGFTRAQDEAAFAEIRAFLARLGVWRGSGPTSGRRPSSGPR
jgi:acetyl esterase/lipase